jgi:hypothetical protein
MTYDCRMRSGFGSVMVVAAVAACGAHDATGGSADAATSSSTRSGQSSATGAASTGVVSTSTSAPASSAVSSSATPVSQMPTVSQGQPLAACGDAPAPTNCCNQVGSCNGVGYYSCYGSGVDAYFLQYAGTLYGCSSQQVAVTTCSDVPDASAATACCLNEAGAEVRQAVAADGC